MKRLFDLAVVFVAAAFLALPILIVAISVRLTSPGPALYWSDRVGQNNRLYRMPKFRTMRVDTPAVATHLLADPHGAAQPQRLGRCELGGVEHLVVDHEAGAGAVGQHHIGQTASGLQVRIIKQLFRLDDGRVRQAGLFELLGQCLRAVRLQALAQLG